MLLLIAFIAARVHAGALLIPMDAEGQTDHLKAYGVTYWALQQGMKAEWLLNYRGGSFLIFDTDSALKKAAMQGVTATTVDDAAVQAIYQQIEENNMDRIPLEKAPKVAVYTPPTADPWDDAVTLALTYADIPYDKIWDEEALDGKLNNYDWLHLHHEDFTGQYGKFYRSFRNTPWYQEQVRQFEAMARKAGYSKVQDHKGAVAEAIHDYVQRGGFLFAMCAATDTLDIALAARGLDIVAPEIDGDGLTPGYQEKLNFNNTLAFTNFSLVTNPLIYEFSDIDTGPSPVTPGERYQAQFFTLFDFSAKFDPVPTILTQDHTSKVPDFLGQTTAFRKSKLKPNVIVLADFPGTGVAKYIHGVLGDGTFTFLAGHDPEDAQHLVGEGDTDLSQHPNSPGYRLILNNVLFPAAKKKPRKT
ncbi:MAG: asparagine synthetase B [bacterium]|nr:asparagine synthetase B [bacterium]